MISLGLFAAMMVVLGWSYFRGYRRGLSKTIFHAGYLVARIVLSILGTRLLFSYAMSMFTETLVSAAPDMEAIFTDPAIAGLAASLLQMLSSAFVFLLLYVISGIVLKPFELIIRRLALGRHKRSKWGGLVGVFCGLLVITALYTPINGFLHIGSKAIYVIEGVEYGAELPPSNTETAKATQTVVDLDRSIFSRIQRTLGGKSLFSLLTKTEYLGTETNLNQESDAMIGMVSAGVKLSELPAAQWGDAQADALHNMAVSFGESKLMPQALSALISTANTQWNNGQSFLGMEKPQVSPVVQPTLDLLLKSLGNSTPAEISHSLVAVADMMGVLSEHGAFASLSSGDSAGIVDMLSDQALLPDLLDCMYDDKNLRLCIPELINLGLRALADQMDIPQDKQALYDDFMDQIAAAFNDGLANCQTRSDRLSALTDDMMEISNQYGLQMTEVGALYVATYLIDDLGNSAVTSEQIEQWFVDYALATSGSVDQLSAGFQQPNVVLLGGKSSGFSGKADYSGPVPVHFMEFTYTKGTSTVTVAIFTRSDGSVVSQIKELGGISNTPWYTTAEFLEGVMNHSMALVMNKGKIVSYSCTDPSFTVTVAPRALSRTEAAFVNASFALGMDAEQAVEELTTVLPSLIADDPRGEIKVPKCMKKVLKDAGLPAPEVMSASEFVQATSDCAQETGFSTGNANTLQSSESMQTDRVTLKDMELDSEQVAQQLPNMNKDAISNSLSDVMSAASAILTPDGEGGSLDVNAAISALNGIQGAIAEMDTATQTPPTQSTAPAAPGKNQAIMNGLLQSDKIQQTLPMEEEVLGDLSGVLGGDAEQTTNIIADLSALIDAISAATEEGSDPAAVKQQLSKVLTELSVDGANAIAKFISPDLLKSLGVEQEEVCQDLSILIGGFFADLAVAKETMTPEQFQKEADALQIMIDLALDSKQSQSNLFFGEQGRFGMSAQEFVNSVMGSDILTQNLLKVIMLNANSQRFAVKEEIVNLFGGSGLAAQDKTALEAALNAYYAQNGANLPTADDVFDLWANSGVRTKTDVARRLAAILVLFGQTDQDFDALYGGALHLANDAAIQILRMEEKKNGDGVIIFTLYASGTVTAEVQNGGNSGILTNADHFYPNAMTGSLAQHLTITEQELIWKPMKSNKNLMVTDTKLA